MENCLSKKSESPTDFKKYPNIFKARMQKHEFTSHILEVFHKIMYNRK